MNFDCGYTTPCTFADLVHKLLDLISLTIPLIFAITLLVLIWKVIDAWILNAGDTSKIEEGKQTVLIGVIVLVVMTGIWGIVAILRSSLLG